MNTLLDEWIEWRTIQSKQSEQEYAWFYHKTSGNVIYSNVSRMYASNIGHDVIKIENSQHKSKEQILLILKEKHYDNNNLREEGKSGDRSLQ